VLVLRYPCVPNFSPPVSQCSHLAAAVVHSDFILKNSRVKPRFGQRPNHTPAVGLCGSCNGKIGRRTGPTRISTSPGSNTGFEVETQKAQLRGRQLQCDRPLSPGCKAILPKPLSSSSGRATLASQVVGEEKNRLLCRARAVIGDIDATSMVSLSRTCSGVSRADSRA
jgi:hypothetical protein